jgi:hypothetical protein
MEEMDFTHTMQAVVEDILVEEQVLMMDQEVEQVVVEDLDI